MSALKEAFYNYKTLLLHPRPIYTFFFTLPDDRHLWKICLGICLADMTTWTLLLVSFL